MHIEVDVIEILIVIAFYFFMLWGSRLIVLMVIGKLVENMKGRLKGSINDLGKKGEGE